MTDSPALLQRFAGPDSLILGIGNVGREDDGLGWAFVDWLEQSGAAGSAELRRCYQLGLEDADLVSRYHRVLFVDATRDAAVIGCAVLDPAAAFDVPFTSHALTVPTVLATARLCFGAEPETRLLALRGYSFRLQEGLTSGAMASLAAAQSTMTPPIAVPSPPAHPGGRR